MLDLSKNTFVTYFTLLQTAVPSLPSLLVMLWAAFLKSIVN